MDQLKKLCFVCARLQVTGQFDKRSHHIQYQEFRKAIENKCAICTCIWSHAGEGLQDMWQNMPDTAWSPIYYSMYEDDSDEHVVKLVLTYTNTSSFAEVRLIRFRLLSTQDETYERLFPPLELESSTSSRSTLSAALLWLKSCHEQHTRCGEVQSEPGAWHPTRLIHIGSEGSLNWKLRIMADIPSSITPYMTLSYRWSLDPGLRLLSSTMHDFLVGSPIKNLPQTFQDLIIVARCFGIHYIWIDALCIIQDSIEDWELEALTMRLVYTNSYCNVAASASVDEHGGLFRSRNVETLRHIMVELPALGSGPQTYYLVDRDYCDKHIFDSHLHQRGWVFQERHLAPRVLHFGKSQVLWECFEDLRCEGFPNGVPNYWSQRTLDSLWSLKNRNDTSPKQSTEKGTFPDSVYFLWNRLVKSYSDCIFTKSSDKLLAFSGIAKIFQEVTGDDYLAGLWRSRLLDGLDWRVYDPWELTSSQYRAPSWSWASIDGPLRYDTICGRSVPLIEVTKIDIQPYKSDPTGSIISASLSLKGHLIKFECMHYEPGGNYTVRSGTKQLMTRLLLDTLYRSLRTGDSVYCLPLKTIPMVISSGFTTEVFLLLLEMTEKIDTFRRIGHFVMNQEDIQEYFDLQIGGFEIGPLCPRKLSTITIV